MFLDAIMLIATLRSLLANRIYYSSPAVGQLANKIVSDSCLLRFHRTAHLMLLDVPRTCLRLPPFSSGKPLDEIEFEGDPAFHFSISLAIQTVQHL